MAHGGARTGAGRKARPSRKEKDNEQFDERASQALPELFDAIYAIATGYKIAAYEKPRKGTSKEMVDKDGETLFVYTVPPDKSAVFYLVDRAAGKASVKNPEQTDTELTLEVTMSPLEVEQ